MIGTCFPDTIVHHSPNGAHLAGSPSSRFKQMGALLGDGMKKGWPDLICLWDGGVAFMEVKRPKRSVTSAEQTAMLTRLIDMGWRARIVKSVDEAFDFLKEAGAPCKAELQ
jgi:hypothetical protein